jgi:fatty-acyl-CoA synthase
MTARTLAEALDRIPEGTEPGFRFIASDLHESRLPYSGLREAAHRRAARLSALGLQKGDRAALVVADDAEFLVSFLACVAAGVVPVPIAPFETRSVEGFRDTVAGIVREARADTLLTLEASREKLQPLVGHRNAGRLERILTMEGDLAGDAPPFRAPDIRPDDLCFLQFTSGSVAAPRGVMITHANLMANIALLSGPEGFGPPRTEPYPDLVVSWLPLFHDMGLIGCALTSLVSNVPAVIISTLAFARDPRIWLRRIHDFRGTVTYAPNFAYALVARRLRDRDLETLDLRSLRVAGCGAEPIHAPTLRAFAERLAPTGFRAESLMTSYGLAECTLAVTVRRARMPLRVDAVEADALARGEARPAGPDNGKVLEFLSCGMALPGYDLAVLDEQGAALPDRRVGQIVARGPSVAAGYYGNPEATAATWKDGWLHTGDLGYLVEGELFVCGRLKDLVIIRGRNFHPHDIESAVRDLPGVRHGNVVAFGTSRRGDETLVVMAETDGADPGALRRALAARVHEAIGLECRPVLVSRGSLPKTTSGKLQRTKAKRLFEEGILLDRFETVAPECLSGSREAV